MSFLLVTCAQAPKLSAMLVMAGDRKKETCDKLDAMELELGSAGLTQLIECGGDFPAAYKHAKAFCATGGGHVCNTANALVRLYARVCKYGV